MLLLLLACRLPGLGPEAGMRWDDLPSAGGTPSEAPGAAATSLSRVEPTTLADRWWVIVATARDAPRVPARLGGRPFVVPTSGFARLMPCWQALVADTYATEAEAVAARDALKARGVDAYARFSGAWNGPDAQLDAYCARLAHPVKGRFTLVSTDARPALPVDVPAATLDALAGLTTPAAAGPRAWWAPLGIQNAGARTLGDPIELVDAMSGERRTCRIDGFGLLTLGVAYEGEPPCGAPELVATLDCALSGEAWLEAPVGTEVWEQAEELDLGRLRARWPSGYSRAVAAPQPGTETGAWLRVWRRGDRALGLAEAWVHQDGGCGGDEARWWAWVDPDTGALRGAWVEAPYTRLVGVVDVDGGEPEVLRAEDYGDVALWSGPDERARRHYGLCVCPC